MMDNDIFKTLNDDLRPCVATIGFFDGVHRGHQFLIANVMEEARKAGLQSLVITFDRHPRQVLSQNYQPRLLTTLERKLQLLSLTGVDNVAVLHFTKDMAALSARDFMQQILHDKLYVRELIIGYDNRFGHNRAEGFEDYVGYGKEMGIKVMQSTPFSVGNIKVSSSSPAPSWRVARLRWRRAASDGLMSSRVPSSKAFSKAASLASPQRTSIRATACCSSPKVASMPSRLR